MYIDTHCHMVKEYYDDMDKYVSNCILNNVKKIIVNATDKKSCLEVLELVKKYDIVYGALGFHPTELDEVSEEDFDWLEEVINNDKIVAIGEIGLDYHYDNTDKEKQICFFKRQLEIAVKYNKPIIVHTRDSIQDTYDILKKYNVKGVIHCYSGSLEMAREFIKLGYYIGIGGISTFKNASNIINVIKNIDLEYIVLETDSPYLTPEPYRKYKNESMYIPLISKKISEIKEVEEQLVMNTTTDSAQRIFDF